MTVQRIENKDGPGKMWVTLSSSSPSPSSESNATDHQATQEIIIPMVDKQESEIFASLINTITSATATSAAAASSSVIIRTIEPTLEELSQLEEIEERRKVAQADTKRNKELLEKNRAEEEMLRRARGELVGAAASR